jgi:acetylornithine deacetylase/succinyl-diaminopimelate desuccinylase-like protein
MQNLVIDAERLWGELMETAAIGGTPKGGICRLTLTDLDRQVRDWFRARCEGLGCTVTIDDMGAMFARRPGQRNDIPRSRWGPTSTRNRPAASLMVCLVYLARSKLCARSCKRVTRLLRRSRW